MRRLIWLILTFLVVGCGSDAPPQPTVLIGKTKVPVLLSSHCWNSCADYADPAEHLQTAGYEPIKVPFGPGVDIQIAYPSEPVEGFVVTTWWDGKSESHDPVKGRRFTISSMLVPGVHTYSVSARWRKGSATHVFQIEVVK